MDLLIRQLSFQDRLQRALGGFFFPLSLKAEGEIFLITSCAFFPSVTFPQHCQEKSGLHMEVDAAQRKPFWLTLLGDINQSFVLSLLKSHFSTVSSRDIKTPTAPSRNRSCVEAEGCFPEILFLGWSPKAQHPGDHPALPPDLAMASLAQQSLGKHLKQLLG